MSNNLALFDLDHTLLNCDSDVEWSRYLFEKGYLDSKAQSLREKYSQDYQDGSLNLDEFLNFQLAPLAKFDYQALQSMHQEFMQEYIISLIAPKAIELVNSHLNKQDDVILVSATNEFIITPIAHYFGIQEVIGVQLVKDNQGNYTGKYHGICSYREGKVTRVEHWLEAHHKKWHDYQATYFYSDSFNDIPLLEKVSHPYAVHPDAILRSHALEKHWPIISLL